MKIAKKRDRILAFTIDCLIFAFIFLGFAYFYGDVNQEHNKITVSGFPAFILFIITLGLWPFSEALTGQTFGKKIVGLKVVNKINKDISGGQAFMRFCLSFFDLFMLAGLLVASQNKNNQRIGDLVANTIVTEINK